MKNLKRAITSLLSTALFVIANATPAVNGMNVTRVENGFYFEDSFNYNVGELYGNGSWLRYGQKSSDPIMIVDANLTYPGYSETTTSRAVKIMNNPGSASNQILFGNEGPKSKVFFSALLNIEKLPSSSKNAAFLTFTGENSLDGKFGDAEAGSEGGGLFVKAEGSQFKFGISRKILNMGNASNTIEWTDKLYDINTTYLVVLGYEKIEGEANDVFKLWINPADAATSTPEIIIDDKSDMEETLVDLRGIQLRQGSGPVAKTPIVVVDEVRVADEMQKVLDGDTEVVTPQINISESEIDFGGVYCGLSYKKTITVSGENLEGDITIETSDSGIVSVSKTQITKEEAAEGVNIEITIVPGSLSVWNDKVKFSSPNAVGRTLSIVWNPLEITVIQNIRDLYKDNADMDVVYLYKGEATITFVDKDFFTFYAQDSDGAIEVRSANNCGYDEIDISKIKDGDVITNLIGHIICSDDGGIDFIPVNNDSWEVVSENATVEPMVVTFDEMRKAEAADLMFRLITVKNVTFDEKYRMNPDMYDIFNNAMHFVSDNTTKENNMIWYFHNTEISKTSTEGYFDNVWNVTGICYYLNPQAAVAPRYLSDFEKVCPLGIEENLYNNEVEKIFDVNGTLSDGKAPGLYIVKMTDGTTRKIVVR